ncbi:hypothetical protein KJ359_002771 [Pestalotiopsis sp. 9143b]|nr:hypothetical protein KJ359_002771 [Pestalotiopsis sp. 9143b]
MSVAKARENHGITYDDTNACFRVHCHRDDQSEVVSRVGKVMDKIVSEEDVSPALIEDLDNSIISHASRRSAAPLSKEEHHKFEVFSYPTQILPYPFRGVWKMPSNRAEEGLDIHQLLLKHDSASLLIDCNTATVVQGGDGLTLHFGANSAHEISEAKKKMDKLLQYHCMGHQLGINRLTILIEDDSTGLVELRYLASANLVYVRNVVLDPTRFNLKQGYGKLFKQACVVRSVRMQQGLGHLVPEAADLRPAVSKQHAEHAFEFFRDYTVTKKEPIWAELALSMSKGATDEPRTPTLIAFNDGRPSQMNSHADAHVLSWAKAVSQFDFKPHMPSSVISGGLITKSQPFKLPTKTSLGVRDGTSIAELEDSKDATKTVTCANGRNSGGLGKFTDTSPYLLDLSDADGLDAATTQFTNVSVGISTQELISSFDSLSLLDSFPSKTIHQTAPAAAAPQMWQSRMPRSGPATTDGEIESSTDGGYTEPTAVEDDPATPVNGIITSLTQVLNPLRLYQGSVSLKAELGRIWFVGINKHHVGVSGPEHPHRLKEVPVMEETLGNNNAIKNMYFNNILTLHGGDVNHMITVPRSDGIGLMWVPGCSRVFYEFYCMTKTTSGGNTFFVLEVDASDFSYAIRKADPRESNIFVQCAKRDFDFRVVVEAAFDITESCEDFAQEVVASLQVDSNNQGTSTPDLQFTCFREWGVDIMNVRLRQVATYDHHKGTAKLHITHVHCMKKKAVVKDKTYSHFQAWPDLGNPSEGIFPKWFEAHITSPDINKALAQNKWLGFAQEASWTTNNFKKSGAFDTLLGVITAMVKQMDGVGYWVNNEQSDPRSSRPPQTQTPSEKQDPSKRKDFW